MVQVKQISFDRFEKLLGALPRNPDLLTWRIPLPQTFPKTVVKIEATSNTPVVIAPIVYEYALFCREKGNDGQHIWVFQGDVLI